LNGFFRTRQVDFSIAVSLLSLSRGMGCTVRIGCGRDVACGRDAGCGGETGCGRDVACALEIGCGCGIACGSLSCAISDLSAGLLRCTRATERDAGVCRFRCAKEVLANRFSVVFPFVVAGLLTAVD